MRKGIKYIAALTALMMIAGLTGCKKDEEALPDETLPDDTIQTPADRPAGGSDIGDVGTMNSLNYWLDRLSTPDTVLMDSESIAAYNAALTEDPATRCVDLATHPASLSKDELTGLLGEEKTPVEERFIGTTKATDAYYQQILANVNAGAIAAQNDVGYGYATDNIGMRTFPTADPSYEFPDDLEFDLFAETLVKLWEPVLVLHTSADKKWYYAQVYNYRGWLPANGVALAADKTEWQRYYEPTAHLVVTGNRVTLNENVYNSHAAGLELFMGTVLPLNEEALPATIDGMDSRTGWAVLLPENVGGKLSVSTTLVPYNADVTKGWMPYTQGNVLRQGFKMLGDRLGWSGTQKSRDASGLVMDIYQSFGVQLPRNSAQQDVAPGTSTDLSGLDDAAKLAKLAELPAGSLLNNDGLVAIYLGEEGGTPYMLHALYVGHDAAGTQKIINAVTVTDLSMYDKEGQTYLSGLKTAKVIA